MIWLMSSVLICSLKLLSIISSELEREREIEKTFSIKLQRYCKHYRLTVRQQKAHHLTEASTQLQCPRDGWPHSSGGGGILSRNNTTCVDRCRFSTDWAVSCRKRVNFSPPLTFLCRSTLPRYWCREWRIPSERVRKSPADTIKTAIYNCS